MNLTRTTVLLAATVSTLACHDAGAPPVPPVTFTLDNINGISLPYVPAIPEAPTVISAALLLETSGLATIIEHRRQMAVDVTDTRTYTYKINGNEIRFAYSPPCPINALCIAPPKGTITGSRVLLDMSGGNGTPVYNFRLIASD